MSKHCIIWHFFIFVKQIGAKPWVIVTLQQNRVDAAAEVLFPKLLVAESLQNIHFLKDIGLKGYAVERHFWHFFEK